MYFPIEIQFGMKHVLVVYHVPYMAKLSSGKTFVVGIENERLR